MITDENYYYPETEQELACFIGGPYMIKCDGVYSYGKHGDSSTLSHEDLEFIENGFKYRIPKFTLDDLSVGDTIGFRTKNKGDYHRRFTVIVDDKDMAWFKEKFNEVIANELRFKDALLQIGRNTWVEIKTGANNE